MSGGIPTWRERLGVSEDFPLAMPSSVERAMEAEIADLRATTAPSLASAPAGYRPSLMRQAVASVGYPVNGKFRINWMRPERLEVGTLLYCASEPAPAAEGAARAAALEWHAPGMGEVYSHDHTYMIDCQREIDDPDQDYIADDELAKRVCAAMNRDCATQTQALRGVLNTTLWLYRRLPHAYGKPPFVDAAILTMAKHLGMDDVPESIRERATAHSEAAESSASQNNEMTKE